MDTPQRANAAQMAARNIKAAKGGRLQSRRPGTASSKTSFQEIGNSIPQFASVPATDAPLPSQSGGLFGGTIQAPGTFDFSGPGGSFSFSTEKIQDPNISSNTSDNENRFAGDDRATKRQFGGGSTTSQSKTTFPRFGSNPQNNAFGGSKPSQPSGNSLFSFNIPAPSATPTASINFNPPQASPAKPLFSFGGTPQSSQANAGNSFGSNTKGDQSANTSFGSNPPPSQGSIFNFASSAPQQQQNTPFQFGQAPAPSPTSGINFGSAQTTSTPGNGLFGATQTSSPFSSSGMDLGPTSATSQPTSNLLGTAQSNSGLNFGSTPSTSQPTSNLFGIVAPPSSSGINFGSTAAASQPTSNLFARAAPPSSSGVDLGSTPTTSAFSNNNFNTTQASQAPAAPNFLGATSQPPSSSSGPFAGFHASASAAPTPFGNQGQGAVPANNLFGGQASQPEQSKGLFGKTNSTSSQSGLPSQSSSSAAPTTSIFNSPSKPEARSSLFSSQPQGHTSTGEIVGNTDNTSKSTNDLFGNLNKPVDSSVTQPKINGFSTNSLPKSSNLFGSSKSLFSAPSISSPSPNVNKQSEFTESSKHASSVAVTNHNTKPQFTFGQTPTKESSNSKNIFSTSNSLNLPSNADQPPPRGIFPHLTQSATKQNQKSIDLPQSGDDEMPPTEAEEVNSLTLSKLAVIQQMPDSKIEKQFPPSSPDARREQFALLRIKALNAEMSRMFDRLPYTVDPSEVLEFYMNQRVEILSASKMYAGNKKRKEREDPEESVRPQNRPNRRPMAPPPSSQAPADGRKPRSDNHGAEPSKSTSQLGSINPLPTQFNRDPLTNGNSQAGFSQPSNITGGTPIKDTNAFPTSAAATNSTPSTSSKGKRKAEDELTQDTEQVNPLRSIKTPKLNGVFSASAAGSSTSNLFKGIVDTPSEKKGSPERKLASLRETAKDEAPRLNPFGSLPVPKSPIKSTAESPTAGQSMPTNSTAPSQPNMFAIKGAATTSQSNTLESSNISSASQPMFASNSASASTSANPFAAKAGSTTQQANPFAPKDQSATAVTSSTPPDPTSSTKNPFQLKPIANPAKGAGESDKSIKPPNFGSFLGSNAMDQFRKKAEEDKKKKEQEDMEKAKDEEWDEDEQTESDWEQGYWAEQKAKKEQKEQERNNLKSAGPKFTFKPAQDAKPTQDTSSSKSKDQYALSNATRDSLFAKYTQQYNSGNSAANSMNGSRTSTPGPVGSTTGSVLDGHGPSQTVKNIFGHLSDNGSGKDEADVNSDNEEDLKGFDEEEEEDDSENRDPNYFPSAENGSGPGTPAEETGAGIASAKKSTLFGYSNGSPFIANANSGTSTPSRSLFDRIGPKPVAEPQAEEKPPASTTTGGLSDRIAKDSNGNPLRHISSEEKENTQPSSNNIFGDSKNQFSSSFNKSSATPTDQTWKQDSPIKFCNPSNNEEPAPTVSITAATPTKASSKPSNSSTESTSGYTLTPFGQKNDSKPAAPSPFLGLLGGKGGNTQVPSSFSVGFAFGGAPSIASSLHPSAGGSAATSRGTSPGGTTDGASDDPEDDADAEHHEQIDLTAGGPGEENEEVVHEVRAKALRFEIGTDGSQWVTAGLGPLRVLKHEETGVSRVLLRGDPSGKIVLNKGILGNLKYTAEAKTVKFLASNGRNDLETFVLQVKTPEFAQKLAEVLNENKLT